MREKIAHDEKAQYKYLLNIPYRNISKCPLFDAPSTTSSPSHAGDGGAAGDDLQEDDASTHRGGEALGAGHQLLKQRHGTHVRGVRLLHLPHWLDVHILTYFMAFKFKFRYSG